MATIEPHQLIPIISIFSGPGGMDLGFRRQGFLPVLAIDIDSSAVDTYNFNDKRKIARQSDLSKLTDAQIISLIGEVAPNVKPRGVIGGPPCQSVSVSNVHHKRHDPRKRLLLRYARILGTLNREFQLDFFVFENVPGLKSKKHRRYFLKLLKAFEEAGFNVFEEELNAKNFGVAQDRTRLFIVGINKRLYPNIQFEFPVGNSNNEVTVQDVIGGLPEPAYFRRDIKLKDIPYHPNHWTMNPRSPKFNNGSNGKGRSFRVLKWNEPSWTVAYGNREMHIHPSGIRRVSVFEAMRLQGFPKTYRLRGTLTQQVTQVSDAVPPPLANAMAKAVGEAIYKRIKVIQKNLLAWFEKSHRSFPWRRTKDPYRILIAEKLLQQTAATEQVIAVYKEITALYPSIEALSKASSTMLRRIIAPLGFSYRADELPRMAQVILNRHNGDVPTNIKDLLNLPGIGDYAARALLSFAYGQDVPIVDTNVARFLHRIYGITTPMPSNPARNKQLIDMASALIPKGQSRNFNLAVLDLCFSVCKPRNPQCNDCSLQDSCASGITTVKK